MHIEYEISFLGQAVVLSPIRIAVEGPCRMKLLKLTQLICFVFCALDELFVNYNTSINKNYSSGKFILHDVKLKIS